jgi:hypothetical protein
MVRNLAHHLFFAQGQKRGFLGMCGDTFGIFLDFCVGVPREHAQGRRLWSGLRG